MTNREIDRVFHRFFRKGGVVAIVGDSIAHVLVEQDPSKSAEKFLEYNLGPLIREVLKSLRAEQKTRTTRKRLGV